MFKPTRVRRKAGKTSFKAEFHTRSGRLRIFADGVVSHDLFPPHSWFVIASYSWGSRWGTHPNKVDLLHVLNHFVEQWPDFRHGAGDGVLPDCCMSCG
ncbi:hypothetical protein DR64_8160 [Paraburkholderia xenovorans LB400]|nr:hypothetical protein [Paraburkholderia xenovorans]AIP34128.1 hypothetical protein DR64_8160 [Paraburkholderia xenovorans LB400]